MPKDEELQSTIDRERALLDRDIESYRVAIRSAVKRSRAIAAAVQELEDRATNPNRPKQNTR